MDCVGPIVAALVATHYNPNPYLFWISVGAPFIIKVRENNLLAPIFFISSFYIFLIGSMMLLGFIVGKSRSFLKSKVYIIVMRVLSIMLAIFAVILLKDAITYFLR